jgi:probable F420-dependent oxidoreductase
VELKFGVSVARGWTEPAGLHEAVRRAEELGFDVVTAADHLGAPAPFQVLATAAALTSRIRLRTYVLDSYFWNPALLARETATLDVLSGGRVELGVGAGHMRHEHTDAGLPFPGVSQRWEHTEALLADVRRRLDGEHSPATVQKPLPFMVAAMGERGLSVAARHADVVGLAGLAQVPGQKAGTFTLATAATTDDRVALVREKAGEAGREPELDVLVQQVVVGRDPAEVAAEQAAEASEEGQGWITADLLLDSPFVLFAESAQAAADELRSRSERWGVRWWSTHWPSRDALAEVVAAARS